MLLFTTLTIGILHFLLGLDFVLPTSNSCPLFRSVYLIVIDALLLSAAFSSRSHRSSSYRLPEPSRVDDMSALSMEEEPTHTTGPAKNTANTSKKQQKKQNQPQSEEQNRSNGSRQPKTSTHKPKGPKGPKPPKGPKGGKPAPKTHDFYYQQLAEDMATAPCHLKPEIKLNEAQPRPSLAESLGSERTVFRTKTTTNITTTTTTTVTKESKLSIYPASSTASSRASSSSDITLNPLPHTKIQKPARPPLRHAKSAVFTLDDISAMESLEHLLEQHGGVQHGGILDKNYSFFVNKARTAAISFIVKDRVAVVGGDPLCEPELFYDVFAEFKQYRRKHGLGLAIFGGSDALLEYGKKHKWASIRFGTERVLNPMNNPVLQEKAQKQVIRQNKQLLDPKRGGLSLGIYSPSQGRDKHLQDQLVGVYDAWREARNDSGVAQAFTTVYDPFAIPSLMIYIYTKDKDGVPNGFAALRRMGSKNGYYIDPCVAAPGAPRRITDLLYFAAMTLLNALGCGYLSIGMEPARELEMSGFPGPVERLAKRIHGRMFEGLRLAGKKEYHDKFRPEEDLQGGLHLMFPRGVPGPRSLCAVMHFANISIRRLVKTRLDYKGPRADTGKDEKGENGPENNSSEGESDSSARDEQVQK